MEDGGGWSVLLRQCHPISAGPSSLLEERSKTPIVVVVGVIAFVVSFVLSTTPQTGGNGQDI